MRIIKPQLERPTKHPRELQTTNPLPQQRNNNQNRPPDLQITKSVTELFQWKVGSELGTRGAPRATPFSNC